MSIPDQNLDHAGAVTQLRAAFDDGKLAQQDYDSRVARALAAGSQQEIDQLFSDLPDYTPAANVAPASVFESYVGPPPEGAAGQVNDFGPVPGQPATTVNRWTDPDGTKHSVERTEVTDPDGSTRVTERTEVVGPNGSRSFSERTVTTSRSSNRVSETTKTSKSKKTGKSWSWSFGKKRG